MSGSSTDNLHSILSSVSPKPGQDQHLFPTIEIRKNTRRRASSPFPWARNRRAFIPGDSSGGSRPRFVSQDLEPQPILMDAWTRMKIEVPKILYANMLASLFTWLLLIGFIFFPATFSMIRNSHALDGMGKVSNVIVRVSQTIPWLGVAIVCCACGVSSLSWLWLGKSQNFIWPGDRIFL
jgi:hypothetical protein